MINRVSGRRLIALAAGVTLVSAVTLATGGPASAVETLTIHSATPTTPGLTTHIDVSASSSSDITQITATIRLHGSADVFATVEDFTPLSGTARDGVWRSATAVTVDDHRRYAIDIDATNAAGYHRHLTYVGVIDNGIDVTFSQFLVTPTVFDVEHRKVTYSGRLVQALSDGTESGVAGAGVVLESVTQNGSRNILDRTTTGPDGTFSSTAELSYEQRLRVVSVHDATYRSAQSGLVTVSRKTLPTRISIGVKANPGVIGEKVTLTGRLERQSLAGSWGGLAGQPVRISFHSGGASIDNAAEATTGSDGTYVVNVVIPARGQWGVQFPADLFNTATGYGYSSEITGLVDAQYRSTVTGFDASPEPVGKGVPVKTKGRVVRELVDGTTAGLANAYVELEFSADGKTWASQAPAHADGNGYFTVSATAVKDGYWRAHFLETYENKDSVSGSDHVDVKYRTSFSSFNAAPEPVVKGKTITVSGKLNRYVTAWGPLGGKTVYIYFRPYKATAWSYMGVATSDKYGKWHRGFKASRDGTWYAKYKGSDTYLPVTSGGDYVDVR